MYELATPRVMFHPGDYLQIYDGYVCVCVCVTSKICIQLELATKYLYIKQSVIISGQHDAVVSKLLNGNHIWINSKISCPRNRAFRWL